MVPEIGATLDILAAGMVKNLVIFKYREQQKIYLNCKYVKHGISACSRICPLI
jgi:hypothetical protein